MTLEEFLSSLNNPSPPPACSRYLEALWREKRGDWNTAHEIVQQIDDQSAAWVHAYLHRREGDQDNAAYWYGQAHRPFPDSSLDEEWESVVAGLIAMNS